MTKASKGTPWGVTLTAWGSLQMGVERSHGTSYSSSAQYFSWRGKIESKQNKTCLRGGLRKLIYNKCCLVEDPTFAQQLALPPPVTFVLDKSKGSSQFLKDATDHSTERHKGKQNPCREWEAFFSDPVHAYFTWQCSVSRQHAVLQNCTISACLQKTDESIDT